MWLAQVKRKVSSYRCSIRAINIYLTIYASRIEAVPGSFGMKLIVCTATIFNLQSSIATFQLKNSVASHTGGSLDILAA